ncbi:MAG: hypothetical protein KAT34_10590 [Candidatus Aminicenantes bacterium]|nr:hypothetical protein [Candidatus Aminicenantes bacterium]
MINEHKKDINKKDKIGTFRIAVTPVNAMVKPKIIVLNSEKLKKGAVYV